MSEAKLSSIEKRIPFYQDVGNEIEIFQHAFRSKLPLMLKGPTGCGKSRFVEHMAAKLSLPLTQVLCQDDTSATDLLGRYLINGGETVWHDGPMTRTVRRGGILYLDEIAEAREDVMVVIHPLTDHRRELYVDKHNEALKAPDNFMLIVSFNPGYQKGMKELKPSTRQRFLGLQFGYPEKEVEAKIISIESGVGEGVAKKLVTLGQKIRNLQELGLSETVSTRLLVDAGILIHAGLAPRIACDTAVVQPLTDDLIIISSLRDLVALIF